MISSQTEYQKAREELEYLTHWLSRLENSQASANKNLTIAGVRKMISRLQKELSECEAAGVSKLPLLREGMLPDGSGVEKES